MIDFCMNSEAELFLIGQIVAGFYFGELSGYNKINQPH